MREVRERQGRDNDQDDDARKTGDERMIRDLVPFDEPFGDQTVVRVG